MSPCSFSLSIFLARFLALVVVLLPATARAEEPVDYSAEYQKLIQAEQAKRDRQVLAEQMAGGLAAVLVGTYGYYNDGKNLLSKMIYSGTQTAGVVILSQAISDVYSPSLLLSIDRFIDKRGSLDASRFQRGIVAVERKKKQAEAYSLAYTSGVLSVIYGYNGYREKDSTALRNMFFFLSGNLAFVAGVNAVQIATGTYEHKRAQSYVPDLEFRPFPALAWRF